MLRLSHYLQFPFHCCSRQHVVSAQWANTYSTLHTQCLSHLNLGWTESPRLESTKRMQEFFSNRPPRYCYYNTLHQIVTPRRPNGPMEFVSRSTADGRFLVLRCTRMRWPGFAVVSAGTYSTGLDRSSAVSCFAAVKRTEHSASSGWQTKIIILFSPCRLNDRANGGCFAEMVQHGRPAANNNLVNDLLHLH